MTTVKEQRASYETMARKAAAHILGTEPEPFAPQRMSKLAHWFGDPQGTCLIAVVMPGEKSTAGDEVLAYGLAWQQNRDLHLVLPDDMIAEALTRKAWIDTEVRIWQYGGDGTPHVVPSVGRFQLFSHLRDLPFRKSRVAVLTGTHAEWLTGIETAGLIRHDRSYVSWHRDGLQVLRVAKTAGGLRIQAGVQYAGAKRPQGREPFDKVFATAPTPGEVAVINAKIRLAIEDGGSQTSRMDEHKMQATLISQPETLGLTTLWREFPAWRGLKASLSGPSGRPGYIDFLGADAEGGLHVVETKIGHDPTVVLQALDYAIWVAANDDAIRAALKAQGHSLPKPPTPAMSAGSPAPIHLVLGATSTDKAVNGYLAGQLESLAGDVRATVHVTAEPTARPLALVKVPKRQLWNASALVAAPVAGPRWAESVTQGLVDRS